MKHNKHFLSIGGGVSHNTGHLEEGVIAIHYKYDN